MYESTSFSKDTKPLKTGCLSNGLVLKFEFENYSYYHFLIFKAVGMNVGYMEERTDCQSIDCDADMSFQRTKVF